MYYVFCIMYYYVLYIGVCVCVYVYVIKKYLPFLKFLIGFILK